MLDTNQFVSSLISKAGPSAQLLQAWREQAYVLMTSRDILGEIERVLRYPRIARTYRLESEAIDALIHLVEREAVVLTKTPKLDVITDDPDDNAILGCAVKASAHYLVSGDHHLLALGRYRRIAIVTAREFLAVLEHQTTT